MTTSEEQASVGSLEVERLRAENESLRRRLEEKAAPAGGPTWRNRWLSVVSAVLAALFLPLAVITVWARNTMLDTDTYVATVAPLAENEDIQEAVSFRVTETVAEAADFRSIAEEALPPDAAVLAGPIEAGAKSLISELVSGAVASPAFAQLWEGAHREAHSTVVPLFKGESNDLVATEEGRVVVTLGSVAEDVVARVDERLGTQLAEQIPEEELDAEVVLFESQELADAQAAVRLVDRLSWFSVILTVVFVVGAVWLAERRRLGARRVGVAVFVPMLLMLVAYAWARNQYTASLPETVHNPDAAVAAFDILTNFLQRSLRAMLVVGALVLIGAWLMGPSLWAGRVRDGWGVLVGRAGEAGVGRDVGPVVRWIGANERGLQYATVVVGGLVAVLWSRPTGLVIVLIVICTLLVMAAVRLVAELARRAAASPEPEAAEVR